MVREDRPVEINQCLGCTDVAALTPSSGEERAVKLISFPHRRRRELVLILRLGQGLERGRVDLREGVVRRREDCERTGARQMAGKLVETERCQQIEGARFET